VTGSHADPQDNDWYSEQFRKWTDVAATWHEGEPPAVPSEQDLRTFCDYLATSARAPRRVVLLGATVALRRALLRDARFAETEVIVVDFSPEMLAVTTDVLADECDLSRERQLVADWRELATAVRPPVDAVIGDKSFDNLAFGDWAAVFESCATVLPDGGVLVLHVGLVDPNYAAFKPHECLEQWARSVDSGGCSLPEAASGLWEDLLTASAYVGDPGDHELSVSKFGPELVRIAARSAKDTTETRLLEEFERRFGSSNNARWTAFVLRDLYAKSEPWFAAGRIATSDDYVAANLQPIVELVRRPQRRGALDG
jgi:SAM-dependent methyltransferase